MSTLGPTSVGTVYGIAPAVFSTRGVGLVGPVPSVGGVSGDSPAPVSQAPIAASATGVATTIDEISQEAALVDGAIAMPARPLAEIIWHLRAAVNAGRGSVRTSRAQVVSGDIATGEPHDDTPKKPAARTNTVAARAYAVFQAVGERRTPARSVDVSTGKK